MLLRLTVTPHSKHLWHELRSVYYTLTCVNHFHKRNMFCALTAMSSSCKSKPRCFGSDIHRLLLAAEAGQKADIVTYYSGHLGPRSLNQNQPNRDPKQVIWKLSQSQEENPNRLTLPQIQAKTLTYVKKKELNESPSEFTTGAALVESEVSESRQDQATDHSSHAHRGEDLSLPKIVHSPSQSLMGPHKRSNFPSSPKQKKQSYSLNPSDQEGLNIEDQMKTKQKYGRKFIAKQDRWAAINVAEIHERKLHRVRIVKHHPTASAITLFKSFKLSNMSTFHKMIIFKCLLHTLAQGAWIKKRADFHAHPNLLTSCVYWCMCVPVISRSWRNCQRRAGPTETALRCSVTSLMMYVKARQYLDASWGKLRFFHFLCTQ